MKRHTAPIILDTGNFSKQADKARDLDYDMAALIESCLSIQNISEYRFNLFNELICARSNVSALSSYQLLLKDMKIVSNKNGTKIVAIPGYPMLVSEYIKLENVEENLHKFMENYKADVIILVGLKMTGEKVERDICIINGKDQQLFDVILKNLILSQDPDFGFEEHSPDDKLMGLGLYYKQNNVKMSRKQILPVVKKCLEGIK